MIIFFFKQKTAYEMRISDWSSDVCSSDLPVGLPEGRAQSRGVHEVGAQGAASDAEAHARCLQAAGYSLAAGGLRLLAGRRRGQRRHRLRPRGAGPRGGALHRSEEHTSELQSLMRISYAVFCLKKKKHKKQQP